MICENFATIEIKSFNSASFSKIKCYFPLGFINVRLLLYLFCSLDTLLFVGVKIT